MRDPLSEDWVSMLNVQRVMEILDSASCYFSYVDDRRIIAICNEDINFEGIDLGGLEEFRVFETPISSIDYLEAIETLKVVDVHQTKIMNLDSLDGLSIEYLDLSITPLQDISTITNIRSLKTLKLSGLNIRDLTPIGNLENLEELHIDFCYEVRSIEPLRDLKKLRILNMAHTNIRDLSPLIDLAERGNLELVDLTDTNASPELVKKLVEMGVRVIIRAREPSLRL